MSESDSEQSLSSMRENDWQLLAEGLRKRKADKRAAADDDTVDCEETASTACSKQLCLGFGVFLLVLTGLATFQAWMYFHPSPITCSLAHVRAQKFKLDVTDLFAPRVSAALNLVLSLGNSNMLRSMLLEQCKLVVYEDETGLKLGSAQQGSLVLSPFSSTQVTVALNSLASALPLPEQRRLAAAFLAKKALLLTVVATASSRVPKRGSSISSVSSNSSRRVDLAALAKGEVFFQRASLPTTGDDEDTIHDAA